MEWRPFSSNSGVGCCGAFGVWKPELGGRSERSAVKHALVVAPQGGEASLHPGSASSVNSQSGAPKAPNPVPPANRAPSPVGQGMPVFDDIMNSALAARGIPGGALAIAKDGKLLVARGYGLANVRTGEPVTLDTLFSTAAVTKTITAAAVLRLVDRGKLSLDDPIYPLLGKPRPLGRPTVDSRVEKITVRHLLLNAGGWNTKYHADLLGQTRKIAFAAAEKLPLSAKAVLRYGLSQPLDFAPGTEVHNSNFGYFLAKVVVERSVGQPYESYVRQQVLRPMGIEEMRIEQLAPAYAAREAHRYGAGGRELSGGRKPIAAPAGNWLASVVDLARFLTAVSGAGGRPFLSSAARQADARRSASAAGDAAQRRAPWLGLGLRDGGAPRNPILQAGFGSGRTCLSRTPLGRHRLGAAVELQRASTGPAIRRGRNHSQGPPRDRSHSRLARSQSLRGPGRDSQRGNKGRAHE